MPSQNCFLLLRQQTHHVHNPKYIRYPPQRLRCPSRRIHSTPVCSKGPITDRSRILEKPTRFNPPSHPSRRVKPRVYPGPRLSDEEIHRQKTKRYPNMMPPEGTLWHSILHDRKLHAWITLSVLVSVAAYSMSLSFYRTTAFREELPRREDLLSHPIQTVAQFARVYKKHVEFESAKVAEKRRHKIEDAAKRKEFLRAHGVEPGFLTGSWMDKFGTIEDDEATRKALEYTAEQRKMDVRETDGEAARLEDEETTAPREKKKRQRRVWLGIW